MQLWSVTSTRSDSSVSHIIAGNLNANQDGTSDIIIARDDGSVEIYNFDDQSEPSLRYQINF